MFHENSKSIKSPQYTLLYLQVQVHRAEKENTTKSTTESMSHGSGGKSQHTQVLYFSKNMYMCGN